MRFTTLSQWLEWQETLHPRAIDLGLDRVATVAARLGVLRPAPVVVTVAGTNGKGSSVALLGAIYHAAEYRVGLYSSPHLLRYNERVHVAGRDVGDEELCAAFQRVDDARGDLSLTYFEFGTLAALDIFQRAQLDIAVLEVGMGGRLDAVNIVDADVALIASIDIDHADWLGADRETIGREKAGIMRAGMPVVCSDRDPPRTILAQASMLGAPLYLLGREFFAEDPAQGQWRWIGPTREYRDLPPPALQGARQLDNAAAALMVVELLQQRLPVPAAGLAAGLAQVCLPGRFQVISGSVTTVLDVAHNPQSAAVLAETLSRFACAGQVRAVVAMLADKDIDATLQAMLPQVDHWYVASLKMPRGAPAGRLGAVLQHPGVGARVAICADVSSAYRLALAQAIEGDCVVVFGSFYTVAEVLGQGV